MLLLHGPRGRVHSLAFSPDGTTLAYACGRNQRIELSDLARDQASSSAAHADRIDSLAFCPVGPPRLAFSDVAGKVQIWDLNETWPRPVDQVHCYSDLPLRLAFSPDGRLLAATGIAVSTDDLPVYYRPNYGVTLWQWQQGAGMSEPIENRPGAVFALAFSPDGRMLALGGIDRNVYVRDLSQRRMLATLLHDRKVHFLTFCCEGRRLASASPDGLIRIWDVESGEKMRNLRGQGKVMQAMTASPDGRMLATASSDGRVRLWDAETGRVLQAYDWGIGPLSSLAFAPDGLRAAAGGSGTVVVWDIDL